MAPLLAPEACRRPSEVQTLWLRGGFPGSFLAPDDAVAWSWRDAFIRNLFTRDLPALGIGAAPDTLQRFWRMLAHRHGQLFNAAAIAGALGVSSPTVTRYLDALTSALLGRRKIGFEIKFSLSPKPAKGFWQAIEDVRVERAYVVAPVKAGFALAANVDVLPVRQLREVLNRL